MKHFIVCCDGTWQTLDQREPTVIARLAAGFAAADAGGAAQIIYYDRGVGAPFDGGAPGLIARLGAGLERIAGGAFGAGLEAKIFAAYRFLAINYAPGDRISVFGFSRGAYLARSLCGLLYASGLVRRDALDQLAQAWALYRDPHIKAGDPEARSFRQSHAREVAITFLGCFDTVAARGAPDLIGSAPFDRWLNRTHQFHDHRVNPSIRRARHACAIDEDRAAFALTPMAGAGPVVEMWFPGFHGGVGGGEPAARPFADAALGWMVDEARAAGLDVDPRLETGLAPEPLAPLTAPAGLTRLVRRTRRIGAHAQLHDSVQARWSAVADWRPEALEAVRARLDPAPEIKGCGLYEEKQNRHHHGGVDDAAGEGAFARHARFSRRGPVWSGAMAVS